MKRLAMHAIVWGMAIGAGSAIAQVAEQSPTISPAATRTTVTGSASPLVVKIDSATAADIAGQPIGRIENVVLSPVGCAEAAIVVGSNGRLIPVPWTFVQATPAVAVGTTLGSNLRFTINVDQQRILQAPSFARTELPTIMNNQQWLQQSVTFFGSANVGATGTPGSTAVGRDQGRFGTTATTVPTNSTSTTLPNSGTATRVPTNSSSTVLPPTGRPQPGQPASPGQPSQPSTPDNSQTSPSQPASPSRPTTPPSSSPTRP